MQPGVQRADPAPCPRRRAQSINPACRRAAGHQPAEHNRRPPEPATATSRLRGCARCHGIRASAAGRPRGTDVVCPGGTDLWPTVLLTPPPGPTTNQAASATTSKASATATVRLRRTRAETRRFPGRPRGSGRDGRTAPPGGPASPPGGRLPESAPSHVLPAARPGREPRDSGTALILPGAWPGQPACTLQRRRCRQTRHPRYALPVSLPSRQAQAGLASLPARHARHVGWPKSGRIIRYRSRPCHAVAHGARRFGAAAGDRHPAPRTPLPQAASWPGPTRMADRAGTRSQGGAGSRWTGWPPRPHGRRGASRWPRRACPPGSGPGSRW